MKVAAVRWFRRWVLLVGFAASAAAAPAWREILEQPENWYGSPEALSAARTVLAYQLPSGGWPKNTDMTVPPAAARAADEATIDNGATTTPLWLLARIVGAGDRDPAVRTAVERGLDYLFAAQYANGGWPQFFPLKAGYSSHITYNDNAMINVLTLLQAVAEQRAPFHWLDPARRERAGDAVRRGIDCILRTQVVVDGVLTVWCAQHDERTLAPAPARAFEPISLSGAESVNILAFLMDQPRPSADVVRAVHAGVAWLEAVKLSGWRVVRPPLPQSARRDQVLEPASAEQVVWARFYEIGTNRPIFVGRDRVVRDSLAEVEEERRAGYAYYGTWGRSLLERVYPVWRDSHPPR